MLLPPGQKHFTVYVVSSLFGSVSVLYAVLKNSNCNRSSYFTLKWSSFTTAALYLLCLYLRYTQSHLTGCIYFFKFRRQIFFWLCPGVKSISWVLFQGSLFLPHRNTSPLLQALGFSALLIRNAQPTTGPSFLPICRFEHMNHYLSISRKVCGEISKNFYRRPLIQYTMHRLLCPLFKNTH